MGFEIIKPIIIIKGVANRAICIPEPTAISMQRLTLFFNAITTAVIYSDAFPAIGTTIIPRKLWDKLNLGERYSIELTSMLLSIATTEVNNIKRSSGLYSFCLDSFLIVLSA